MTWHCIGDCKLEYRSGGKVLGYILISGKTFYPFCQGQKLQDESFTSQLAAREFVEQRVDRWLSEAGLIPVASVESLWKQIDYLADVDRGTIELVGKLFDTVLHP